MPVTEDLLNIIACPACKGRLEPDPGGGALICAACSLRFPVRDGIPLLVADQAQPLEPPPECVPVEKGAKTP
ncbi:MAG TPA: hypothetical protein DCZ75_14375 [Geobacter sp.]|nr:hypothetical protein [Geobacter sp.]